MKYIVVSFNDWTSHINLLHDMNLKDYNFFVSHKLGMIAILYNNISLKVTKNTKLQNKLVESH